MAKNACSGITHFSGKNCRNVLQELLMKVHELHVCVGNPDEKFLSLMDRRKGNIKNGTTNSAFVDGFFPVYVEGKRYEQTVHAAMCEMLVCEQKCECCKEYRPTL